MAFRRTLNRRRRYNDYMDLINGDLLSFGFGLPTLLSRYLEWAMMMAIFGLGVGKGFPIPLLATDTFAAAPWPRRMLWLYDVGFLSRAPRSRNESCDPHAVRSAASSPSPLTPSIAISLHLLPVPSTMACGCSQRRRSSRPAWLTVV